MAARGIIAKKKTGLWLTKDNRLIVMEAVMNPLEYKLLNYFMIKAVEAGRLNNLEVSVSEIRERAKIKGTNYTSVLKKATRTITSTVIHVERSDIADEWEDISLVSKMGCKSGYVYCDFNNELKNYIFGHFPSFTRTEYELVSSLVSYAAMRLYEICNSWKRKDYVKYDVRKWRAMLGNKTVTLNLHKSV